MELQIMTPMEPGVLPEIQWNNEELKEQVSVKAREYASIAYTDEQETEMRKDRAALNKLVNAFEDERKQVKKFYMGPYEKFDAQVKEVLDPVRNAIKTIDTGLAEIDRKYRVDKVNKMRVYYDQYVENLRGIVPFEKTVREELYKKSITDKKLEQSYITLFKRVREELAALDELPERFRDKALMKYAEALSLTEAMREGKRLEELEKVLEERKRRQEEEKAAREAAAQEAERKAAAARAEAAAQAPAQPQKEEAPVTSVQEQQENPIMSLAFRAYGTREQLMGLRQYMIDNGIKFGKVE